METTTITTQTTSPTRRVAVNALAVVGFVVLIILGMALAVYAATFVPKAITRLGGAAVYLSSVFVPTEEATLEVVAPVAVVPFPDASTATSTPEVETPVQPAQAPRAVTQGTPTTTTYPVGTVVTQPAVLSGLSDLTIAITAKGYLTSSDTASFIKGDSVPSGARPAVKFTITNAGTNLSGRFTFKAPLPTSSTYTFTSDSQDSLLPGEHIDYVLGFDRARTGDSRDMTITVDPDNLIVEANERNNSDSITLDIK